MVGNFFLMQIPAMFGSIAMKRTFVKPAIGAWSVLRNDSFHHCIVKGLVNGRWIRRAMKRFMLLWGLREDYGLP